MTCTNAEKVGMLYFYLILRFLYHIINIVYRHKLEKDMRIPYGNDSLYVDAFSFRVTIGFMALLIHETNPGHHLQVR
jgi:hypothetical protein